MMMHRVNRRKFLGAAVSATSGLSLVSANQQLGAAEQVALAAKNPVIDTHMHVWSGDLKRWPFDHPYTPNFKSKQRLLRVKSSSKR